MRRLALTALFTALLFAHAASAQESTSGQARDAQVNWSALSNRLNTLDTQNKALAGSLQKVLTCNAKQMVFAPAASGKDADGCINPATGNLLTGKTGWFGKDGYMPGAHDACPSRDDDAACPTGWVVIGYDQCQPGDGKIHVGVFCAELKK